jgi:hypothetical protein
MGKRRKSEPTLRHLVQLLTKEDRDYICDMLNQYTPRAYKVHHGMLPFIPIKEVFALTNLMAVGGFALARKRVIKVIESSPEATVRMNLFLRDQLVLKHFGKRPYLGKPLSHLPKKRVTVGVKWSLPKQSWVPDTDVLVSPTVALKKINTDFWEATCEACYWNEVHAWLIENCLRIGGKSGKNR